MAVFYPLLTANTIDLDDTRMITNLNNPLREYSVKKIFWPGKPRRYYRPLLMYSFVLDSKIWALEYSGYHLTNNILHTLNAIVLYFIGLKLFRLGHYGKKMAFLAAVLYAVHPLVVEPVAWISGRTDILATFFSLLAYLFYLYKLRWKYIIVPIMIFLGLLSKESALSMIPIIVISEFIFVYKDKKNLRSLVPAVRWMTILLIPLLAYFYLRFAGFKLVSSQLHEVSASRGNFLKKNSFFSDIFLLPAMTSFYIKKLIIPFPLNFLISNINTFLYTILFFVIALVNLVLIIKKQFFFPVWLMMIILAFIPALPVALSDVAWTKYAERYLYLAVPGFCLLLCSIISELMEKFENKKKIILTVFLIICFLFFLGTVKRIYTWKSKQTLWADTLKKNPDHGMALFKYGNILENNNAVPYFKKAVQVDNDNEWKDLSLMALAKIAVREKNYTAAKEYIHKALKINPSLSNLDQGAGIIRRIMNEDKSDKADSIQFLIQIYKKAYKKKPRPIDLYNLVIVYINAGNRLNAEKYYQMLQKKFPNSRAARILVKKYTKL